MGYVKGRQVIVIANDITFQGGSFSVEEDQLFYRASELARKLKVPRLYISANSGARIGLDKQIRNCFKVKWRDPKKPEKGVEFLYLEQKDFDLLNKKKEVKCKKKKKKKKKK